MAQEEEGQLQKVGTWESIKRWEKRDVGMDTVQTVVGVRQWWPRL